eukprot:1150374-Pelagomonas_calceolata.AAC.7
MNERIVKTCTGSEPVEWDRLYPHSRKTPDEGVEDLTPKMNFRNLKGHSECSYLSHSPVEDREPKFD